MDENYNLQTQTQPYEDNRSANMYRIRTSLYFFYSGSKVIETILAAAYCKGAKECKSALSERERGVHGSVRFGLDLKNQPNQISVCLINSNRTGPETGSNRTGPVRLNPVFFGKNRET